MNKNEKKVLAGAVSTMINFGIKFLDNIEDESVYEPDIKKLLDYCIIFYYFNYTKV